MDEQDEESEWPKTDGPNVYTVDLFRKELGDLKLWRPFHADSLKSAKAQASQILHNFANDKTGQIDVKPAFACVMDIDGRPLAVLSVQFGGDATFKIVDTPHLLERFFERKD